MIIEILLLMLFCIIIIARYFNSFSSIFLIGMLVGISMLILSNLFNIMSFSSYEYVFAFEKVIYKFFRLFKVNVFGNKCIMLIGVAIYCISCTLIVSRGVVDTNKIGNRITASLVIFVSLMFIFANLPTVSEKIFSRSFSNPFYLQLNSAIENYNIIYILGTFLYSLSRLITGVKKTQILHKKKVGFYSIIFLCGFETAFLYILLFTSMKLYLSPIKINEFYMFNEYQKGVEIFIPIILVVSFIVFYIYMKGFSDIDIIKKNESFNKKKKTLDFEDVRHIMHSYKNSLMRINVLAVKTKNIYGTDEGLQNLNSIEDITIEYSKHTLELLDYYQNKKLQKEKFDIYNCLNNVLDGCETDGIEVNVYNTLNDTEIIGNEASIRECISNIVVNAVEALNRKRGAYKRIDIRLFEEKNMLCIEINDNGIGISRKNIRNIFRPLFSTKEGFSNWGMGLSQVEEIIRKHRGSINVKSRENEYTCVQLVMMRK